VKNWFRKFISHFRGDRDLISLNLSVNRQTRRRELRLSPDLQPTSLRALVWTREEAEAAWKAKRTEVNVAIMLPKNIKSVQSVAGNFMVDGRPARVEVCLNESIKQWILTPPDKKLEQEREQGGLEREQERLERQKWKPSPDPKPIEGRTCGACGGKLVLIGLYNWERSTDVFTPAGTGEKCLRCGTLTEL
jgi:hypothetical protein